MADTFYVQRDEFEEYQRRVRYSIRSLTATINQYTTTTTSTTTTSTTTTSTTTTTTLP